MKLLVVAATAAEVSTFASASAGKADILITGVGMPATVYALTKHLQNNKYDFVIQAGIGGCFDTNIPLGTVVFVTGDRYGDMGAEDHDKYLDVYEMGLADSDKAPFTDGILIAPVSDYHKSIELQKVHGITVNTVSGSEPTITQRKKYRCEMESMEGAAFHLVCLEEGVPFAQIRSISNYVTPRDRASWKIKEAVINLNDWLINFIHKL